MEILKIEIKSCTISPEKAPVSLLVEYTHYQHLCAGSRNGKYSNGTANGHGLPSLHYDNGGLGGPIYSGLSTGPRPPPAVYQPPMTPRARTPNRTPRSRARARHRAREAGQFDLAPDQYSLHSRPASQAGSYRKQAAILPLIS
jgi:hypothetical protein